MAGDISWRILSCVEDVRALLSASFLWSVSWINREANCAYHFFARWSLQNLLWGPIEFKKKKKKVSRPRDRGSYIPGKK